MALYQAKASLYSLKQGSSQSTAEYYKLFQNQLSIIESYGGQIHDSANAAPPKAVVSSLASDAFRDAYMRVRGTAATLLSNADPTRFGSLLSALSNAYSVGRDKYPTSLNEAYQLLLRYKDASNLVASSHPRLPRHHS
jgi:hypothetical protein